VIGRVRRHRQAATLLHQLREPGCAGRHGIHLLGGTPEPADVEPGRALGNGSLRHLADWLSEPLALLHPGGPRRPVWHCIVEAHPDDPGLTDQQWARTAADIMHRTGLAPLGDARAVRWAAARHGDGHMHIIATLARQDGTVPPAGSDFSRVRNACHAAEDRYGLHSTRLAGKTGPAGACTQA
jgi:hypothetical protein